MSWTQTVLRLVEAPLPGQPETSALARRKLRKLDDDVWQQLRSAKAEAQADGVNLALVSSQDVDLHDYLTEDQAPAPAEYELRLAKSDVAAEIRFLESDGARMSAIGNPGEFESATILRLADIDRPMQGSIGIAVLPWDAAVPERRELPHFARPTRTVRDYAKSSTVPSNVATWLVAEDKAIIGLHPLFGPLATQRLALCIPNSIEGDPLHLVARLEGKLKAKSNVEPVDDPIWMDTSFYRVLNEACMWIFSEPREASNKHALLTGEIARAWGDSRWGAGLNRALEDALVSAQVAYRLHLQEKGVDALKLMADLRKGVAEDVRSVSNQISALSAALWRDAAVALGTVALRNTGAVGDWVTYLVAVYLAVGGYLTLRWADQTVAAIGENELAFRRSLYRPLLTDNTYKELALTRYRDVFAEFRTFWRIVAVIYLSAIMGVLGTVGVPLFLADVGGAKTFVMNLPAWSVELSHKVVTPNS